MQFNVAQQLKEAIGSTKSYDIEGKLSRRGEIGPVAIRGPISMMRTDRGILVQGSLTASVQCICVRCLTQFDQPEELAIEEEYVPVQDLSAGSARQALEAEGLIINAENLLDLEPALREYIILNTPMKPLCRQDCAGLCSSCGANLNDRRCSCPEPKGDGPGSVCQLLSRP
ncbi:MAG: DUF177 domain-containing protein [Dehalococcoidia bacterium]